MSMPNAIDVCRRDLFTREAELKEQYPPALVEKVLRVREMYTWFIANPDALDSEFIEEECKRHDIHRTTAYSDLSVVKALLPMLSTASRDFHKWRTSEMLMATYKLAEKRKDTKTMERAAASYGRIHGAEKEEETQLPLDKILPQPFTATDDPTPLGITPIPNLQEKIQSLLDKYRKETIDIEDVEFEECDLEFDTLFPDPKEDNGAEFGLL